jgi:pimeloyl-ACP methyl ester carboxylesterase
MIRHDALGHGFSSGAPKGHPKTIEIVAAEIVDTLDQLKLDKFHYLGESTGGIFASFLGAKYPDRFHSVATCGSPLVLTKAAQRTLSFGILVVLNRSESSERNAGVRNMSSSVQRIKVLRMGSFLGI